MLKTKYHFQGNGKDEPMQIQTYKRINHSYNFVTGFEIFDIRSNLYNLSCHISAYTNKQYVDYVQ